MGLTLNQSPLLVLPTVISLTGEGGIPIDLLDGGRGLNRSADRESLDLESPYKECWTSAEGLLSRWIYIQGRIQDFVLGGTKFGKVIWEYYYYCLICLWNVWCRKIKIDLQVIMIIWGEETKPLFSLCVFFLLHLFFFVYLGFFFCFFPPPSESASGICDYC